MLYQPTFYNDLLCFCWNIILSLMQCWVGDLAVAHFWRWSLLLLYGPLDTNPADFMCVYLLTYFDQKAHAFIAEQFIYAYKHMLSDIFFMPATVFPWWEKNIIFYKYVWLIPFAWCIIFFFVNNVVNKQVFNVHIFNRYGMMLWGRQIVFLSSLHLDSLPQFSASGMGTEDYFIRLFKLSSCVSRRLISFIGELFFTIY